MKPRFQRFQILFPAIVLAGSGCSVFDPYLPEEAPVEEPAVVPLAERPRQEPINRNYFVLESAGDSVIGETQLVFTRDSDTFSDLAREYGLGYDEIAAANPDVDPWLPGEGTAVVLPTRFVLPDAPREGVVLNIASKRLFYYPPGQDGRPQTVMTYPIGIGRVGWETPTGETTVVSRAKDPTWYVPASVRKEHAEAGDPLPAVVGPGPDNPLGRHVLKLGIPGYLLHGTNQPYGVGMRVSHGCVRLYPENIEVLYSLVDIGEKVRIVNQPYLVGQLDGEFLVEAHEPLADDAVSPEERLDELLSMEMWQSDMDREWLTGVSALASGVPVAVGNVDYAEPRFSARIVRNTVEIDPEAISLEEVRAILDAPESTSAADDSSGDFE